MVARFVPSQLSGIKQRPGKRHFPDIIFSQKGRSMDQETRARLFEEQSDLQHKVEKLKKFILSNEYDELHEYDRKDLKEQLQHMESYHAVLMRRVSRQCGAA
jgi:trans-2-enoyl-CoA reductase